MFPSLWRVDSSFVTVIYDVEDINRLLNRVVVEPYEAAQIRLADQQIEEYKKASEESLARGDRFSRACRACDATEPRVRVVSTACGHACCRGCAKERKRCPLCNSLTTFTRLFEDDLKSRECAICLEVPFQRAFFPSCGHVACCACVTELGKDAQFCPDLMKMTVTCPFCRVKSKSDPLNILHEELIEEKKDKTKTRNIYPISREDQFPISKKLNFNRPNIRMNRVNQPQKRGNHRR